MSENNVSETLSVGDIVEIEITDVAYGGEGVGRHNNRVIFVPFTITGETVKVKIVRRQKRFFFAEPVEIVVASPKRIEPFCKHYQKCGGCQYQHIDYTEQLSILNKQLVDLMQRIGKFEIELPIVDMLPSPKTKHYRNRIDLHQGEGDEYGFCIRRTRPPEIFPLDQCQLFELTDDFSEYPFRRDDNLLVVRTHAGEPYCYFKDDHNNVMSEGYSLADRTPLESEDVYYEVNGMKFLASYSGFFQVNPSILPTLIDTVQKFAKPKASDILLDVYCGVGIFGLSMAKKVKKVMGVELDKGCIEYANRNAAALKFENCEFTAEEAEVYCRRLWDNDVHVDVCVLDPPRNGLTNKVVSSLKRIRPKTMVYVSCGPSTFARDAKKFVEMGYEIEVIQPIDLFPHTKHFELVAKFNRVTEKYIGE